MPDLFEPLSDEDVWGQSKWLIDEMQHGMSLYEGYIPSVTHKSFMAGIHELSKTHGLSDFSNHLVWSNTAEYDPTVEFNLDESLARFAPNEICTLIIDYALRRGEFDFSFRLLCYPQENGTSDVDVVCYREGLQPWHEARERFISSLQHQRELRKTFDGPALFIGPDGCDYPVLPDIIPKWWIRAE